MNKSVDNVKKKNTLIENVDAHFLVERNGWLTEMLEAYRFRLIEHYKKIIYKCYGNPFDYDLIEQFMCEAVSVMQASEAKIIELFFEDAENKYAEMKSEDYFNQVFEVATQFP